MFRRNFFGAGPWNPARSLPTVRLAGQPRPRLAQGGANGCVVPGTQEHPVFQYNPTTKTCSVFWIDQGGSYPDCVQAPPGYPGGSHNGWIPPSCLPSEEPTSIPPDLPPCCTPSWSPGQNKWLVHCQAADERGINQGFSGGVDELDRAKWDALCAYVPPGGCAAGLTMIADQCSPGAIACGDRLVEIDHDSQPTGRILSESWNTEHAYEQLPLGVHMVNQDDPRCQVQSAAPVPTTTQPQIPTSAPAPVSTPGSNYAYPLPTQVTPGASVPIRSGPFSGPAAPPPVRISPGLMPSSAPPPVPQKGFAPATIRPSCQSTPYKVHMFAPTTRATRPDQFTEKQEWTR